MIKLTVRFSDYLAPLFVNPTAISFLRDEGGYTRVGIHGQVWCVKETVEYILLQMEKFK